MRNHERTRLRPHPDISVLSACSPDPRDSEKWKRLRCACRVGVVGNFGASQDGEQEGQGGQKPMTIHARD